MKTPAPFFPLLLATGLVFAGVGRAAQPATGAKVFKAGAATSNITPSLGAMTVGGGSRAATQIHDELHVRCLALDDGATRLVFAVVDSVSVNREVFDQAKRLIREETGVPVEHMMMSATHTHSAVSARGAESPFAFSPADYPPGAKRPASAAPAAPKSGGVSPDDYQTFLVRRIADGVRRAINNLEPARIGWGTGSLPQHVFNRRWLLKDGKTALNPFGGQDRAVMNPTRYRDQLLQPAGPTNPEVYVLSLQSAQGRPIAVLTNYWLHYVGDVGPTDISADYFPVVCDRVQELLGADRLDPPFVGLLANGPCGDVNNVDYAAGPGGKKYAAYEKIRLVANDLAQEVARVNRTIRFQDWVELKAAQTELELQTRRPSPEMLRRAQEIIAKPESVSPQQFPAGNAVSYARRTVAAMEWPERIAIVLQTFRIGGLGVAAIPFETFTQTGLDIKAKSPFKDTFTIELANGGYGYMPTPEQHELGGYETWLGTNKVEKEASTKIIAKLMELFAQVK